jgi:hypothetical protein
MIWSATIGFLELFVLPALAATIANYVFARDSKPRRTPVIAMIIAAYSVAMAAQYFRVRAAKPSSMVTGENLTLKFQRNTSQLTLGYDLLISGGSASGFVLTDMTGTLGASDRFQSTLIPLALNDFNCTADGKAVGLPMGISPNASVHIDCTLKVILTPAQTVETLSAGDHRLDVRLASNLSNELAGAYCFVLTQQALNELIASGSNAKRYVDAKC